MCDLGPLWLRDQGPPVCAGRGVHLGVGVVPRVCRVGVPNVGEIGVLLHPIVHNRVAQAWCVPIPISQDMGTNPCPRGHQDLLSRG